MKLRYRRHRFSTPRWQAHGTGEYPWLMGWGETREAARKMALVNAARSSADITIDPEVEAGRRVLVPGLRLLTGFMRASGTTS